MMSKELTRFSSGTVYSYWLTAVFLSLPMFDILGYDTITLGGKIGNVLLRLMKNNSLPASFIFKLKKSLSFLIICVDVRMKTKTNLRL